MTNKRKDNKGRILHNGEYQQTDGRYRFKYYDGIGNAKYLYSWRLDKNDRAPAGKKMGPLLIVKQNWLFRNVPCKIVEY
ncbi:MAG: integrase DNA-binding domain-containing protein [Lachnospiraceae bacterium]|nr:integrase DNA-binding domain-containing protein [Lachnospiraceae bacterium]